MNQLHTNRLNWFFKLGLASTSVVASLTIAPHLAFTQSAIAQPICYMQSSNGSIQDLSQLCPGNRPQGTAKMTSPEPMDAPDQEWYPPDLPPPQTCPDWSCDLQLPSDRWNRSEADTTESFSSDPSPLIQ